MSGTDEQREYREARAAFDAAMARLREAKAKMSPTARDRFKQRQREKREAERKRYAEYARNNADALDDVTTRALVLLHQKLNFEGAMAREYGGESLRIRLPVEYKVVSPKEDTP